MNYKKTLTFKAFKKSKYFSLKYANYFHIYDSLLKKYRNKKIIFVEIGVFSGGSLFMWRDFFGKKAKIIGIDLNPDIKRFKKYGFDIIIGDQSSKEFWKKFFRKYGKVDVILDDGGHTNLQQSLTAIYTIPFIKNNGLLVIEDTHSSYQKEFNNPSKYSFINFSKKIIDDVNYTYPNLGSFNFSLNKYIYAVEYFESIVCFKIDRKNCKINSRKNNNSKKLDIIDYRYN